MKKTATRAVAILSLMLCSLTALQAQVIYAVSVTGNLITFNAAAPGTILTTTSFTGLTAGQVLEGLDFRPATGQLYALGYNSTTGSTQVYTVKIPTGVASPVGTALTLATGMANMSFDFNPTVDRIRVMSSTRQNYRLNPNDGTLSGTDGTLTYAAGDPNSSTTPQVVTGAYTNNFANPPTTALYFYDVANNVVGNINPPNNGTLNTTGASGISANNAIGLDLDISTNVGTGVSTAYLSADVSGSANNLYTVNLGTGAATLVGTIGGGKIREMAVALSATPVPPKTVYAVQGSNLVTFSSINPGTLLTTTAIMGLGAGETILGMDFRPATGELYALGSASRLYTINLTTAVATAVGSAGAFTLNGTKFGFDFNPTADRIRVVSDADQSLRLNPNDGTLTGNDGTLTYAAGDANASTNPQVGAVAYTNSFAGAPATTLYFYDYNLEVLGTINPPNNGTLNTIAPTGINVFDTGLDMDITSDQAGGTNAAFLSVVITPGSSLFYKINLTTGAPGLVGLIGGGSAISAMAVYLPPPASPAKLAYALSTTGNLVSFSSNNPATILASVPVTGLTAGQAIEGLDFRPATGVLYAVGYNAGNGQTQVYTVNTTTGALTSVAAAVTLAINMGKLAVDFNPQADRIRIIGSTGQSYRLNPADGTAVTDTQLSYIAGDARAGNLPVVHAAAYTNSVSGASSTTLYYYDFNLDNLALTVAPASPNTGVLTTVGNSGLATLSNIDLDITTNQTGLVNTAFLTASLNGTSSNFYLVDLGTGETRLIGTFGGGVIVSEMAISLTDATLPIALTNFAVRKAGLTSELSWVTKSEVNNSYFVAERSADGRTFTAVSGKINSKADNGNSTLSLNYAFTDFKPLKGINYYRLSQVDKDGSIKYSAVIKVVFDGRYEITIYPNPVSKEVRLSGYFADATDVHVKLMDASGRTVAARDYKNAKDNWNTQINVERLQTGMYFLQLTDGKNVLHTETIIKN